MIHVDNLTIAFTIEGGSRLRAVRGVSLDVAHSEAVALVGESGSGKTTLARAVLGDLAPNAVVESGQLTVADQSVLDLTGGALASLRRRVVGYVPQNPGASLNPARRIGAQIDECRTSPSSPSRDELLRRVELSPILARRYPHELSGGQQQRVAIALALANSPRVLVLDEPTTGLDVRVQAGVLDLISSLVGDGISALYVTHDLAAAASVATRVVVMYAGEALEDGAIESVYGRPLHPYSDALLKAMPSVSVTSRLVGIPGRMLAGSERGDCCVFHNRCAHVEPRCASSRPPAVRVGDRLVACFRAPDLTLTGALSDADAPGERAAPSPTQDELLSVSHIVVRYGRSNTTSAVCDATLSLAKGETLAVVGESGSGKTSLARAIVGLVERAGGEVRLDGDVLTGLARKRTQEARRRIQYIFQNAALALNPRQSVGQILSAPLKIFFAMSEADRAGRIAELLDQVQLPARLATVRPGRLSGGEQQRVAIARALAARPDVLICDEVVSALDVSVQASIIELLMGLQRETGVGMLFISHDLAVVRSIADRTLVMSQGDIVEVAETETLFSNPRHEYTRQLLAHVPDAIAPLHTYPADGLGLEVTSTKGST